MRIAGRITIVLLLAAALSGVGCQQAPEPEPEAAAAATPAAPSDEDLLHELAADFAATWDKADAAELSSYWTETGDTLTADGHFEGRAAIQDYYSQGFAGPYAGTGIAIEMTSVRFLQPDVAVADGTYVITGAKGPGGEDLPAIEGLWFNVNVKAGGQWLIASSRPMLAVERPAGDEG
jgi:uncharacterized protein (TIGR02246 family)